MGAFLRYPRRLCLSYCDPRMLTAAMPGGDFDEWQRLYLFTRADTIYGGSNEIQRNIIAKAVLGF